MLTDSLARIQETNLTRYVYTLAKTVYVNAAIFLGDPDKDFENSRNWYITAGNDNSWTNPSFGAYLDKCDRFGGEIKIKALVSKVGFL